MKEKYLIILMLLLSSVSFAQKLVAPISVPKSSICGTPEATEIEMWSKFYYGNNDRLQEKYDSLAQIYGDVGGNPSGNPNYRNGTYGGEDNIWFRVHYTK